MQQKNNDIDKQYNLKKFLKLIYREIEEGEHIRVFQQSGNYNKASYFEDIDEMVKYCTSKYTSYNNTYFTLSTTDGTGGATENLKYRYCISFDFDKKDYEEGFNHRTILNLFKDLKIHYHAMIDTGNGYHVHVMINKTNKLDMVQDVQQAIGKKLKADLNAIKPTQLLRVPFTYNVKNGGHKMVKVIYAENRHKIRPYDIEFLYEKNCVNNKAVKLDNEQTTYTLSGINLPKCIEVALKEGSKPHNKNNDLVNIVVALRLRNKPLSEIKEVVKEWDIKSNYNDNTMYRVEYIYNNQTGYNFNCESCEYFNKCKNTIISDFEFIEGEELLLIPHKHTKDLKYKKRKGAKMMKANDLFIYSVLLNNKGKELTKDDITYLITDKTTKKVAMSSETLRKTLVSLIDNDYIEVIKGIKRLGIADKYKINEVRCGVDKELKISYFCTLAVIWGKMTIDEYRLYTHMRYQHHLEQLEGKAKGNIYRINQVDLAEDLGLTQQRISDMINGLLRSGILDIWEVKQNEKGMDYYTYRLNK